MVELAALSVSDAASRLKMILGKSGAAQPAKDDLLAVYETLLAVTATQEDPAQSLLDEAATYVSRAEPPVVESLPTRARVAMRLLRLGKSDAAWPLLVDGATGVVSRPFNATTSSGAARADWPLPLLTTVEPPCIYAELPGFRDPRFAVPDEVYEVGDALTLRAHVDDVLAGGRPTFAGWAALDLLRSEPTESVAIVARHEGVEVQWPGSRHRRADLPGGSRETLRRRAWAGWRAEIDPADLSGEGRWTLWLEIGQQGVKRRARIGKSAGELAERFVGTQLSVKPSVALVQGNGGWSLNVSAQRSR